MEPMDDHEFSASPLDDQEFRKVRRKGPLTWIFIVLGLVTVAVFGYLILKAGEAEEERWDDYDRAMDLPPEQRAVKMREIVKSEQARKVRVQAILELRDLKDAGAVPVLIGVLDEPGELRRAAAQALAAIGPPAADSAQEALA